MNSNISSSLITKLSVLWLGLIVVGCVSTSPTIFETPFDPSQHKKFVASGSGTITGSLFSKTRGGDVKIGAGSDVILVPDTPFFVEILLDARRRGGFPDRAVFRNTSGTESTTADKELMKRCCRGTIANAQGQFRLSNLPAGKYILVGEVIWQSPGEYYNTTNRGVRMQAVTVKSGGTVDVVLYAQ